MYDELPYTAFVVYVQIAQTMLVVVVLVLLSNMDFI